MLSSARYRRHHHPRKKILYLRILLRHILNHIALSYSVTVLRFLRYTNTVRRPPLAIYF